MSCSPRPAIPRLDHVVVVIMENKSYDQVRGLPYTASLIRAGAILTAARCVSSSSQPNYFALWAGGTLGITNNDCPPEGAPFAGPNLGQACEAAGLSWKAYVENLPSPGSTACSADGDNSSGLYTRKHAPWTCFTNVDHRNERPYSELAGVLGAHALPSLTFIIPNNCHNTHSGCSLTDGDAWLSQNLPPILAELGPKGVLILTYDEADSPDRQHILTVLVGPPVNPGSSYGSVASHYAVTRLICETLGLPLLGLARVEPTIVGIWRDPSPGVGGYAGKERIVR